MSRNCSASRPLARIGFAQAAPCVNVGYPMRDIGERARQFRISSQLLKHRLGLLFMSSSRSNCRGLEFPVAAPSPLRSTPQRLPIFVVRALPPDLAFAVHGVDPQLLPRPTRRRSWSAVTACKPVNNGFRLGKPSAVESLRAPLLIAKSSESFRPLYGTRSLG